MDVLRSTSRRVAHRPIGLTELPLWNVEKPAPIRRGRVEVETLVKVELHTETGLVEVELTT